MAPSFYSEQLGSCVLLAGGFFSFLDDVGSGGASIRVKLLSINVVGSLFLFLLLLLFSRFLFQGFKEE